MNATALALHPLRASHEADWSRLDDILTRAERRGVRSLSDADLLALPLLYRTALTTLSVARETSLDQQLEQYLESLCTRAYLFVYGVRSRPLARIRMFFRRDWPASVRALWPELIAAFLFMLSGIATGWLLVAADPAWHGALVPRDMAGGRDMTASREMLAESLSGGGTSAGLAAFASFLFTNNSQVAILCFALGFAFGIPTIMLLITNGAMLGAMLALFAGQSLGLSFAAWLMIHGTTEILAILIAGAAGMRIGLAVLFPGSRERIAAARDAGRTAATAMIGVILMLFVAGLLEGWARQAITETAWRAGIGAAMLALWAGYFLLAGRASTLGR